MVSRLININNTQWYVQTKITIQGLRAKWVTKNISKRLSKSFSIGKNNQITPKTITMAKRQIRLHQNKRHKRLDKNITKKAWSLWWKILNFTILINDQNGR